jgi:hypothetical protein
MDVKSHWQMAPACRTGNVSACAKFPRGHALLPHHGLADAITPDQVSTAVIAADCCAVMAALWELQDRIHH